MPPRGVKSAKRGRQYEKIKASAKKQGRSAKVAKRIAAATVNKQRREQGETKGSRKRKTLPLLRPVPSFVRAECSSSPPISRASLRLMASPRPVPSWARP